MTASNDPQPGQPISSIDPAPEVVAEIDRRAAALRAAPQDAGAMDAVWRAVYGLKHWLFIARGEPQSPRPYAIAHQQGPLVLAFTTAARARTAGMANGLSGDEAGLVLTVPLPAAADWAASMAGSGVTGFVVDYGTLDLFAPITNLVPMRDWFATGPVTGSPGTGSAPGG
ncbi:hypothetical protein [Pseudactinotalea suaedae]|jgi:hypothetical protein|uniref:hypothetical protein n=1 Tax=Pseudactinotalea suaedae TaxID=1524924 RepID=UPI0012E329AE|nr:hypothetical protein [Pseudactinotalea suaedae]